MQTTDDTSTTADAWSAGELHALADEMAGIGAAHLPVELLDQLDALERIKSAVAAAEVVLAATFADLVEAADDAPADGRRRPPRAMSIGAEVALATRTSPYQGEQRVLLSRRLRDDLKGVHAALGRGHISEAQAFAIARQVAHLDPDQRAAVDADVAATPESLAGLGDEKLRQAVRRSCLASASEAETHRHRRARADRHVTTRQLDDGTGRVTAIVAIEDLAAVSSALDAQAAAARAAGDERTAGQVRSDVLVQRLTGRGPASAAPVRVNLVVGVESLLGAGTEPGLIPGAGWLPAGLCTDLVRRASAAAKASLRRLFVQPEGRALVAMESTSRRFDGLLAEFLTLRDGGRCRTPGCNAVIRHHDHVARAADGGATSAHNGEGLCERCNYVKEAPGWAAWVASEPDGGRHEVHGVTEYLRILRSTAPPMPGGPAGTLDYSPAELHVARALTLAA
ncbi:MAG TPA: DUF222 domain-containing protein [Nocardioides sp.]|nr:DUF222 domain-containing protein [Nocardioides sp.]